MIYFFLSNKFINEPAEKLLEPITKMFLIDIAPHYDKFDFQNKSLVIYFN